MSTEPDNAVQSMSLILIGETIVNVTYRCAAPAEGGWQPPYASFDEEYLERRGENLEPSVTLQGVLPIADYWRQARPTERITALAMAGTALHKTMEQRFGTYVQYAELQNAQLQDLHPKVEERDPRGRRLDRIKTAIDKKLSTIWEGTEVIAPDFSRDTDAADDKKLYVDPLRARLGQLSDLLEKWKPHPGRDVIAIFGESRAGKEYPLNQVLLAKYEPNGKKLLENDIVGPINQFEFLANIQQVAKVLNKKEGRPSVVQIDEIVKGDSARPLLNLLAEKKHSVPTPTGNPNVINFGNTLVVLLSSIDPEHMLTDVRGRLMGSIKIPPLRERWMELPFALPNSLCRGLRYWKPPKTLRVSFRLLSALLHHDYRDHGDDADGTPGLGQQNFRAFEDILAGVFRHARGSKRKTWKQKEESGGKRVQSDYKQWCKSKTKNKALIDEVSLRYVDLPPALREMLPSSASDDKWFVYKLALEPDRLGLPSVLPATTSDITIEPAPPPSAEKTS